MKKLVLISALICFVFLLSSCKKEEYSFEMNTENSRLVPHYTATYAPSTSPVEAETVQIATNTESTEKKKKKTKKETEVPTQGVVNPNGHIPVTTVMGNTTSEDLIFIWNDYSITPNQRINQVFNEIGEDNSSSEISATEMSYEYEDFILYTYFDESEVERVKKIEILAENYSTQKGVTYGDYASSLKKHYGNPVFQTANTKHYGSKNKRLVFVYENNLITEISFEYIVE